MRLKNVGHLSIHVDDYQAGLKFYAETLGIKVATERQMGETRFAMLSTGDFTLEMVGGPLAIQGGPTGEGLHHLGFDVANLADLLAHLSKMGITPLFERDGPVGKIAFLPPTAFRGVLIELVERKPGAPTPAQNGGHRLHSILIAVKDLKAALKLYNDAFGLVPRPGQEEGNVGAGRRTSQLPIGWAQLEVFEPTGPDTPGAKFIASRGEGLYGIVLHVPDLKGTLSTLKEKGIQAAAPAAEGSADNPLIPISPRYTRGVLLVLRQAEHH